MGLGSAGSLSPIAIHWTYREMSLMSIRKPAAAILGMCMVMVLAACGSSDPVSEAQTPGADSSPSAAQELTKMKIALPNVNSAFVNVLLAKESGLFEENGLDVELVTLASPTIAPALVKGDVQLTAGLVSAVNAARAGLPLQVVAATMGGADYTIVADKAITEPADLAGQTFVTGPATSSPGVMANAILEEYGVLKDVKVANIDQGATRVTQLASGNVKAGLVNLDGALRLMAEHENLHLLATPGDFPPVPFTGLAGTKAYIEQNPELVERAIRASLQAGQMLRDEPEKSAGLLAGALDLSPEMAEEVRKHMAEQVILDGTPDAEEVASDAKLSSLTAGEEVTVEEIEAHYDFSIVERVASDLKLTG
jgi:NitT/TauT family transport system substrate-binding protein